MILSRFFIVLLLTAAVYGQTDSSTAAARAADPNAPKPDPVRLEDGGISVEPFYWLNQTQPKLIGGSQATAYGDLSYIGKSKKPLGVEVGIPAGRANTLRVSYFRVQGNTNATVGQDTTLFSELYAAGTYLAASNKIQSAKISWDYLGYTFKNHIRFKELYEFQWVSVSADIVAPYLGTTTDSSGNQDTHSSTGSKNVFLPTLGGELEQQVNKRLRWEIKGSAFGIPKHSYIWDTQADLALRVHPSVELFIGGKAYHFKSSPNSDQYFTDTLTGAYVGVRYYITRVQN